MFYTDEIDEAIKSLDEGQGESIEDSHEDTIKYEDVVFEDNGLSYHQELSNLEKEYNVSEQNLRKRFDENIRKYRSNNPSYIDEATLSANKKEREDIADAQFQEELNGIPSLKSFDDKKKKLLLERNNLIKEERAKILAEAKENGERLSRYEFSERFSAKKNEIHDEYDVAFEKLEKERNKAAKELDALTQKHNRNMFLAAYESNESLIALQYLDELDALRKKKAKDIERLKTKHKDELKYHINHRLKKEPELVGDNTNVLLSVRNLKQFFFFGSKLNHQKLKAVSNVSFDVYKGECFGIVGESGCGKTTTGRTIIKLYKPTSGSIYYRGYRIGAGDRWNRKEIKWSRIRYYDSVIELRKKHDEDLKKAKEENASKEYIDALNVAFKTRLNEMKHDIDEIVRTQKQKISQIRFDQRHTPRKLTNEIQMIFQDPVDSLDPRMTIEEIIQEGLKIQGSYDKRKNHKKVVEMLEKVGLVEEHASRYPHEFSGGQRQRVGIARALIMNPKLLICDEPISALDVSIRAQIINLLNELKEDLGLTLIFIAHDLSVVKYFCDRIAVMYYGKIVELASSDELFKHPLHPYTKSLLSAIPKPNPLTERDRTRIIYKPWEVHDYSQDKPEMREVIPNHFVYCNNKEFEQYLEEVKLKDKE